MDEVPEKLHLGCGKVYLPDWWNVDIFSNVKADDYADITNLPYKRNYFSIIYACHVLEHVHRHMVPAVINHWKSLLKEGGILRLSVPDFGAVVKYYQKTGNLEQLMGILYGGQDYHLNRHTVIFDEKSLTKILDSSNFRNIEHWDWQSTEHSEYDDYSQAYLPHMNKKNGIHMSLNIQAQK